MKMHVNPKISLFSPNWNLKKSFFNTAGAELVLLEVDRSHVQVSAQIYLPGAAFGRSEGTCCFSENDSRSLWSFRFAAKCKLLVLWLGQSFVCFS